MRVYRRFQKRFLSSVAYAKKCGVKIGKDCKINANLNLGSEAWLVEIGDHVEISNNVTFIEHDGATWCFRNETGYEDVIKYGKIVIKNNCFIGAGTIILPGVEIGPNSIVGAGSVVTKKIPEGEIWGGNPAKFICTLQEYKTKCKKNTPVYDKANYGRDKKSVILELLKDRLKI